MIATLGGAEFVSVPYTKHFTPESAWGVVRPKLYQHTDLPAGAGLPMFARDFTVTTPGKVRLFATALGCYEIFVNGVRVGDEELAPGFTEFHKRVLYSEYDIGGLVRVGENRILAVVSCGWYSGRISGNYYGGGDPAFAACITENGKTVCVTDKTWFATVGGQIRTADIWDGEVRDGTQPPYETLSLPDTPLDGWPHPGTVPYAGEVSPFVGPPVRVRKGLSRTPENLTVYDGVTDNGTAYGEVTVCADTATLPVTLKAGQTLVADFGQEVVGWVRITVKSRESTEIKLRYAEFLNDTGDEARGNDGPRGSVYTVNYRSALAKGYYVTRGKETETYRPTFTFYGFRYVEVTADRDVDLVGLVAEVVGTDTKETGKIETSDPLVNRLISNTLWGQRSNYLSIPTDCPQRDERLGWTGDAQVFCTTAAYNADVLGFFDKWLQDVRDSQTEDGGFCDVNPPVECCHADNASAWGDAGVIIPYKMYRMYGEDAVGLLQKQYASMEKYIAQLVNRFGMSGALPRYGDWLAYDLCPNEFISSAYFVYDLDLMTQMSEALGKPDRAAQYCDLRQKAHAYFTATFMKDGKLIGTTQTEKVISLAFRLIDGAYAKTVADDLVTQIKENGNRLSTGFLGTYALCPTLSEYGKDNMPYTLLMQRAEPSWLYSIDQGATTVWERWNSYTREKGFGDVGMNSFNHYAYGAVVEWMYRYAAGIEPDGVGFEHILLRPRVDTRTGAELPEGQTPMTWVKAEYASVKGRIRSEWSREHGFTYRCTVPEGTGATLELPVFGGTVRINGTPHSTSEFPQRNGCAVIELTGGEYTFVQD